MDEAPGPVEVLTFGCRLNMVESAAIRRVAGAAGRENLVVVNSCAVTGEAVRQARQAIRRVRRARPEATIIVTGCAAETEAASFSAMTEVDGLVGNSAKTRAEAWRLPNESAATGVAEAPLQPLADAIAGHTRGFVQVQTGCDHACTFCIIPAGRGQSRSVPLAEVVSAIDRLVDQGFAEVVLTGVDLTSYGADLGEDIRLGNLVRAILRGVPGLRRLRLSSIDSVEVDDALLAALAEEERLMPHLHLSLQSGDDLILKRMKRRHSAADAERFCAAAQRLRPDIVFGADFIAGFPTETEAMFDRTLAHVAACGLTHLHVFPFSPRDGTPAARMPQVAKATAKERAARLREVGVQAVVRHLDRQVGRVIEILAENGGIGRAPDFTPVILPHGTAPGQMIAGRVTGHDGARLCLAPAGAARDETLVVAGSAEYRA